MLATIAPRFRSLPRPLPRVSPASSDIKRIARWSNAPYEPRAPAVKPRSPKPRSLAHAPKKPVEHILEISSLSRPEGVPTSRSAAIVVVLAARIARETLGRSEHMRVCMARVLLARAHRGVANLSARLSTLPTRPMWVACSMPTRRTTSNRFRRERRVGANVESARVFVRPPLQRTNRNGGAHRGSRGGSSRESWGLIAGVVAARRRSRGT